MRTHTYEMIVGSIGRRCVGIVVMLRSLSGRQEHVKNHSSQFGSQVGRPHCPRPSDETAIRYAEKKNIISPDHLKKYRTTANKDPKLVRLKCEASVLAKVKLSQIMEVW